MDYLKILLVFSFFVCLSVGTDKVVPPEPLTQGTKPVVSSSTPGPISTTPSPHNITTLSPNSTTSAPTTTSPKPPTTTSPNPPTTTSPNPPTTTSPNPPTTTPPTTKPTSAPPTTKPTTAPPTTKPTTAPPTTKPTTAPTPTSPPTPVDPSTGKWSLNYTKSNNTCLVIDAALQIELLVVNSTSKKINVPVNATADGTCGNNSDILNLRWKGNVVTMNFTKNTTDKKFELESISVFITDIKNYTLIHEKPEFRTLLDHSYKCAKLQTLNCTEEHKNDTVGYVHISHAQFQAFSNVTGHHFYDAIDCEASSITSDVVPIVVGCILAVLVVVVLVAYLYGRRRCQARGYLSIGSIINSCRRTNSSERIIHFHDVSYLD